MPAEPTAAHSHDRSRHCLPLTVGAQPNGGCGRVVRISRRRSTNLPPIRAIRHRARGRLRDRTRILAPSISLVRVIAEGAGS
jgi:hypothetical protein